MRVWIAGDSTASDYPAERAPQVGWGQALPYYVSDTVVVMNRAVSGRSTKSFIDEGKWNAMVDEIIPGDVVLISFGHNDSRDDAPERYTQPEGEFRDNLIRFAENVLAKDGIPVILSPAARRLWEGPAMVETHGLYAQNARIAADTAGVEFIDLSNLSIAYFEAFGREGTKADFLWLSPESGSARFPDGVEDNTHFTGLGACGAAYVIATALTNTSAGKTLVDPDRLSPDHGENAANRPLEVIACADQLRWSTLK